MSQPDLKLSITFEFELSAPGELRELGHENLCKAMHDLLGAMVLQGMPTVTAKQLGKAGVSVLSHHHHLDVANAAAAAIPRAEYVAAAPHLTDDELVQLARRTSGKLPVIEGERARVLRRHALALVGEFRMVPCVVHARLSSGKDAQLQGRLNLTNGSVLLGEQDRQSRLQPNQDSLRVEGGGTAVGLKASCAGHTLSGPVIEVPLTELAAHRDTLIGLWQKC